MKKGWKILLTVITSFIVIMLVIQLLPVKKSTDLNPFTAEEYGRPLVIAHGGAKDLFPENTMVAFDGSYEIGIDMLEIDVALTQDNILITHHDLTIDSMTDGSGTVRSYTYEELQAFNFAYGFSGLDGSNPYLDDPVSVTKLEDVFIKYPDLLFNVEIKDKGEDGNLAASVLFDLIKKYELQDRILVPSFSDENIQYFRELTEGTVMTSSASDETKTFIYMHLAQVDNLHGKTDYVAMQLPTSNSGVNLDTSAIINDAHRRNIAVHYWTIDDPETMKDLIEKGADGIITDRPDLLNEVLTDMGY